jgi:hypothetical protein
MTATDPWIFLFGPKEKSTAQNCMLEMKADFGGGPEPESALHRVGIQEVSWRK